jgi:arylsulfatase A
MDTPPRAPMPNKKQHRATGISILRVFTIFALAYWQSTSITHAALPAPNIIVILADDMGMGDTSAYQDFTGNSDSNQIATPEMERLANMGIRFTDAHTPGSRCSPTRYSLLTGRYPWRTRLKWWVLFGAQGDPLIERDRPTIGTLLQEAGYKTGIVGKWHVGLRYRQFDNRPAAGWEDASLIHGLVDSPMEHGFGYAHITSRSHGTSGPNALSKNPIKSNHPNQTVGPGHIHGRLILGATGNGRKLVERGPNAYILSKLGSRHSDHAIEFLERHKPGSPFSNAPFFLYYPSNSNHAPYTSDDAINGNPVSGAARTISGREMDTRHDFIHENDVALGRLIDWLEATPDARRPGHRLIENTLVIFTSDNGAEKNSDIATGPFRSNKGSCYEGGHRVPFIANWPAAGIGDGNATTRGTSNVSPIGLQDLYATFAEITKAEMPDLKEGKKGAEDSHSFLPALHGESFRRPSPLFFGDHKEAKEDPAVLAMRLDDPMVDGSRSPGQWKIFFDASLIREGTAHPIELYNLKNDPKESTDLLQNLELAPLVRHLTKQALLHRRSGGPHLAKLASGKRVVFDWRADSPSNQRLKETLNQSTTEIHEERNGLSMTIKASNRFNPTQPRHFTFSADGIGFKENANLQVENSDALHITFNHPVIIESLGLTAGLGQCGGFYRLGGSAPLPVYCVDADNDAKEQHGKITDLGILEAGQVLTIDSTPHLGVEAKGSWKLTNLSIQLLAE